VISVVISASEVKIVTHNPAENPELDRNLRELSLPGPVALLRSNTEFWRALEPLKTPRWGR